MKYLLVLCLLIFADGSSAWRRFFRGRSKDGLGTPNLSRNHTLADDLWFQQELDHFDPTNTQTWHQRYFMNKQFFKPGGPVFIMIGGEGEASAKWMAEGQWIEYAKQFRALCFQLEHRFYGKSHPTQDLSIKNLVYLTSEQALADLAYFIEGMTHLHQIPAGTKFIVFGGSYPGSLAAWMRVKYPHLVHGAVSSSGPLLAKIDFQEYYAVVEDSLKTHCQVCVDSIAAANKQFHAMLRHRIGQQDLSKIFKLCDPLDPAATKKNDIANLYETIASNFAEVVQYNKDNRNSSKTANVTIDTICDVLVDEKQGIPIERLGAVNDLLLKANNETCLDYKYMKMIDELRNVSWKAESSQGGRQWFYQTCTEFGFFQTSTARPELFSEMFPVDFFVQQCTDVFGPRYNIHLLESSVERSNLLYGGLHIEVSNVVYVHGSIDPWHALGITNSSNPLTPAIYINGTAHCANMYPASPSDLPDLVKARQKVGAIIRDWLK
ncbi:putative serine protease K12H4.7 [Cotesia glomerata]|uniref:putative serine protease K12H4.7 n=1 Tax=Cotesia glomerata TaxID=32391 RepID=UPI001D012C10|nr:putative serine protease K12H4.7 [Cotesia glomerata]